MNELATLADLEACLEESGGPVVIFKHSTQCPTSADALDEFEAFVNDHPESARYFYLDLIAHRDVSNAIAQLLDVRHESPQLILLEEGAVKTVLSHGDIDRAKLEELLIQPI